MVLTQEPDAHQPEQFGFIGGNYHVVLHADRQGAKQEVQEDALGADYA